jgi:hypothetical protein
LLLLSSFGCSTTIGVQQPPSSSKLEEIDRLLREREAVVTYAPPAGEPVKDVASEVVVDPDKVRWVRWESEHARSRGSPRGQAVEAPVDAVRSISICEPGCHAQGAAEGAGLGLLLGLAISGILVARCEPSRELGNLCGFLWIPGPTLGILLGALIGSRGHPTIVEFQPPAPGK